MQQQEGLRLVGACLLLCLISAVLPLKASLHPCGFPSLSGLLIPDLHLNPGKEGGSNVWESSTSRTPASHFPPSWGVCRKGAAPRFQQVHVCACVSPHCSPSSRRACVSAIPVLSCGRHVAKPPFFPSYSLGHLLKHRVCLCHGFMTSKSITLSFCNVVHPTNMLPRTRKR